MWWLRWNVKVIEAICLGEPERLRVLHRQGIRMDACSPSGETYLHRVSTLPFRRASEVTETLIELGANVNAALSSQTRPLHTAAIAKNLPVLEVLLNYGADIDARNEFGFTALHYAVGNDDLEMVKVLMHRGANANLATKVGETPLAISHRNESWEIVDLLWDLQLHPHTVRNPVKSSWVTAREIQIVH